MDRKNQENELDDYKLDSVEQNEENKSDDYKLDSVEQNEENKSDDYKLDSIEQNEENESDDYKLDSIEQNGENEPDNLEQSGKDVDEEDTEEVEEQLESEQKIQEENFEELKQGYLEKRKEKLDGIVEDYRQRKKEKELGQIEEDIKNVENKLNSEKHGEEQKWKLESKLEVLLQKYKKVENELRLFSNSFEINFIEDRIKFIEGCSQTQKENCREELERYYQKKRERESHLARVRRSLAEKNLYSQELYFAITISMFGGIEGSTNRKGIERLDLINIHAYIINKYKIPSTTKERDRENASLIINLNQINEWVTKIGAHPSSFTRNNGVNVQTIIIPQIESEIYLEDHYEIMVARVLPSLWEILEDKEVSLCEESVFQINYKIGYLCAITNRNLSEVVYKLQRNSYRKFPHHLFLGYFKVFEQSNFSNLRKKNIESLFIEIQSKGIQNINLEIYIEICSALGQGRDKEISFEYIKFLLHKAQFMPAKSQDKVAAKVGSLIADFMIVEDIHSDNFKSKAQFLKRILREGLSCKTPLLYVKVHGYMLTHILIIAKNEKHRDIAKIFHDKFIEVLAESCYWVLSFLNYSDRNIATRSRISCLVQHSLFFFQWLKIIYKQSSSEEIRLIKGFITEIYQQPQKKLTFVKGHMSLIKKKRMIKRLLSWWKKNEFLADHYKSVINSLSSYSIEKEDIKQIEQILLKVHVNERKISIDFVNKDNNDEFIYTLVAQDNTRNICLKKWQTYETHLEIMRKDVEKALHKKNLNFVKLKMRVAFGNREIDSAWFRF